MGEFITEKEIERLLEFETRNLPIPEPLSKPGGGFISIFKKKPVRMFVNSWEAYDLLVDERFKICTENELVTAAVKTTLEVKTDFDTSLHNVVSHFFTSYKEMNLPILCEIDDMVKEIEEIDRHLRENYPDYDEDE